MDWLKVDEALSWFVEATDEQVMDELGKVDGRMALIVEAASWSVEQHLYVAKG